MTSVLGRTRDIDVAGLATKSDLAVLKSDLAVVKADLKADLSALETRLESRIGKSSDDLLKWIMGMIGFQALTLLAGAVALSKLLR